MKNSKKLNYFIDIECKSPSTKRAYKTHLVAFFQYHNIEDIDNYVKDTRIIDNKKQKIKYLDKIEKDISIYWNYINYDDKNKFKGKTPYLFLSAIKMFLITNNTYELDNLWIKLQKNGHGNVTQTKTDVLSKEQLKKIFSYSNPESKALFMIQITGGFRIGDVLNLELDNFDNLYEKEYPRIRYISQKTNTEVKTRITPEAKKYLIEYLHQKNKFVEIRTKRGNHNRKSKLKENKIFPMALGNVETIWNTMLKNAGFYILDKETNRPIYGTHSLRRYFLTNFSDREWGDYFSGHITARSREYRKPTQEELDKKYIEHSKKLFILEDNLDIKELEKTNQEFEKYKNKTDGQIKSLATLNESLNNDIKKMSETHEKEIREIKQILKFICIANTINKEILGISDEKANKMSLSDLEEVYQKLIKQN